MFNYEVIPHTVLINVSRILNRHKVRMEREVRAAFLAAGKDPEAFGISIQTQIALGDDAPKARPDAHLIGHN